jgi:hypothetical protein
LFVIASEAKQSIVQRSENLDCFVACAPRNDGDLLRHQRVHVLHGLNEIFLEFLHHGAG